MNDFFWSAIPAGYPIVGSVMQPSIGYPAGIAHILLTYFLYLINDVVVKLLLQ